AWMRYVPRNAQRVNERIDLGSPPLPRVIRVALAPFGHEVGKAVVDLVRQDNADGDELIARRAGGDVPHALAAQPENPAGAGALRNGELDAPTDGRHLNLGAKYGLVDADREIQGNIVADTLELRMRTHLDLDQGISRLAAAEAGATLAFQSQHLTILHALGHRQVEHAAFGHGHALAGARDGF